MENDLPAGPDLRLLFDEASRTLSVSLAPDAQFPRIDALWLRNRLAAAGYAELQIRPEPIKQLIARYNPRGAGPPIQSAHCCYRNYELWLCADNYIITKSFFAKSSVLVISCRLPATTLTKVELKIAA